MPDVSSAPPTPPPDRASVPTVRPHRKPAVKASVARPGDRTALAPAMRAAQGQRDLLHRRIRLYCLLMACAQGLKLAAVPSPDATLMHRHVLGTGGLALLVLAGAAALGCYLVLRFRPTLPVPALRAVEGVVVGLAVLFDVTWQFLSLRSVPSYGFDGPNHVSDYVIMCSYTMNNMGMVDILVYGVVVPNTFRRCAVVLITIAVLYVGVAVVTVLTVPHVAEFAFLVIYVTAATMGIVTGTALFSAYRISALKAEAEVAREKVRELGQYQLKQRLGAGGMGEVFLAEHRLLKRPCAIKFIRPELSTSPTTLARFTREVQAMAGLSHFNNVEVYDYGQADDGTFYYAMEYLPGPTLARLVCDHGPLPPGRAVYLLRQLTMALREAHAVGLVHRDLKPGNVIVTRQGGLCDVVKLLDFGLVQDLSGPVGEERLTATGLVLGTPEYLSPEQATGQHVLDARSDLYSLGAIAFFALTGRPPFMSRTVGQLLLAHLNEPPPPLHEMRADVPADLAAVVGRCLEKEPTRRYQSAEDVDEALARCACQADWSALTPALGGAVTKLSPWPRHWRELLKEDSTRPE